jgi:hypothetical protein
VDHVVSGAVADTLLSCAAPRLSPHLFSYRAGMGPHDAVTRFARALREHHRDVERNERGLFVARRDVSSFGESVPVGPRSPLWPALALALAPGVPVDVTRADPLFRVVEESVRPVIGPDAHQRVVGLPIGAPVNTAVNNLYLMPVDDAMRALPAGTHYARYGDDILVYGRDARAVREAARTIDDELARLSLQANEVKAKDLFLTRAGRAPSVDDARATGPWRGAQHVEYLGVSIAADGAIGLKGAHARRVLRELRRRVRSAARALEGEPVDDVARAVCGVVARALSLASPLVLPDARRLFHVVTNREQLAWLDHQIALLAAEAITGVRGPAAFRELPWSTLRSRHGLVSLTARRNEVRA